MGRNLVSIQMLLSKRSKCLKKRRKPKKRTRTTVMMTRVTTRKRKQVRKRSFEHVQYGATRLNFENSHGSALTDIFQMDLACPFERRSTDKPVMGFHPFARGGPISSRV